MRRQRQVTDLINKFYYQTAEMCTAYVKADRPVHRDIGDPPLPYGLIPDPSSFVFIPNALFMNFFQSCKLLNNHQAFQTCCLSSMTGGKQFQVCAHILCCLTQILKQLITQATWHYFRLITDTFTSVVPLLLPDVLLIVQIDDPQIKFVTSLSLTYSLEVRYFVHSLSVSEILNYALNPNFMSNKTVLAVQKLMPI